MAKKSAKKSEANPMLEFLDDKVGSMNIVHVAEVWCQHVDKDRDECVAELTSHTIRHGGGKRVMSVGDLRAFFTQ